VPFESPERRVASAIASASDRGRWYHFSVDDVLDGLLEASDRRLPLFEHPFFGFLQTLHQRHGSICHLYLFQRARRDGRLRTLAEVSDTLGSALRDSPWLRLGPHGLDFDTPPYTQSIPEQTAAFDAIYGEIRRFAPGAALSRWVRLHYFSESYELADYFRTRGVDGLFTTDRDAVSYRLPPTLRAELRERGMLEHAGLTAVRTHARVETLLADRVAPERAVDAMLDRHGFAVLMTHEIELLRPEVREMAEVLLRTLRARGAVSV
jgi:hypothetical protein